MSATPRDELSRFLRQDLQAAADQRDDVPYEQIEAYVDGTLDDVEREVFETRLADDDALRQEVDDLRALRTALRPGEATSADAPARVAPFEPRPSSRPAARTAGPRAATRWALPIGLAAAALVAIALWRAWTPAAPPAQAQRPPTPPPGPSAPNAVQPPPAPALALRDGGRSVGLAPDGTLAGFDGLAADVSARVAEMLRSERVPVSRLAAGALARPGELMGEGTAARPFAPASPLATAVTSSRPTLRWTALAGATSYRVRIVDDRLQPVVEGEPVTTLTWRPATPLPAGRVLIWQVEAATPDGTQTTPAPPMPEARFVVLPAGEARQVRETVAAAGESDLVAAAVYGDAGLYDDADAALQRLLRANPGARVATTLRVELERRRFGVPGEIR